MSLSLPLAATIDTALVGPLAGMDTTVTGERAAVAESLLALGLLAHVRAFARVRALVHGQGRALDERLCASWFLTDKWSN